MKRRGVILLEAVFALMLLGMITYGFAATQAMAFSQASALKDSDKARQYADLEAEIIKAGDFETFGTTTGVHGRKSMQPITGKNDGYESAVSLVQTVAVSEDNTVKIANIDVYKTGEITPRFSLEVPLSSQSGGSSKAFGDFISIDRSWKATHSGFLIAGGSDRSSSLAIYVNGVLTGYVTGRDYGTGTITAYAPVNKGDIVSVGGSVSFIIFRPFN